MNPLILIIIEHLMLNFQQKLFSFLQIMEMNYSYEFIVIGT